MKFTLQRMKFLHSIDGVNYSLDILESTENHSTELLVHFAANQCGRYGHNGTWMSYHCCSRALVRTLP